MLGQALRRDVGTQAWRARVADQTLAAAIAEQEVWGFRDVAELRMGWGDAAGAREALEAGVMAFDATSRSGSWVILAAGFARTLDDRDGVRTCLELCRRDDLDARCDVAKAHAELLDEPEVAAAILDALVPADAREAWPLGNAWQALGRPDRVRDVFEAVLARTSDLDGTLVIARAWSSHDLPDDARRVLDAATSRARTATDWLLVAETCLDLGFTDRVAPALEHAETLAADGATRAKVAAGWLWIGETERAERVGPRGRRPRDVRGPPGDAIGFVPDADALFDHLRAIVTPQSRKAIAGADYGMGYDKHLAALDDLCGTGCVPVPLPWEPREVLELVRWSEGERVDHVARALACTVLTIADGDLSNDVPPLVESAIALGVVVPAIGLLAWRLATDDLPVQRLAALWGLALILAARDRADPALARLAEEAERVVASAPDAPGSLLRWSLRARAWQELTASRLDHAVWRALATATIEP